MTQCQIHGTIKTEDGRCYWCDHPNETPKLDLNDTDKQFLRSLRIKSDDNF